MPSVLPLRFIPQRRGRMPELRWNMRRFYEWDPTIQWIAIAVIYDLTADWLDPIAHVDMLRANLDPSVEDELYYPETLRQLAELLRDLEVRQALSLAQPAIDQMRTLSNAANAPADSAPSRLNIEYALEDLAWLYRNAHSIRLHTVTDDDLARHWLRVFRAALHRIMEEKGFIGFHLSHPISILRSPSEAPEDPIDWFMEISGYGSRAEPEEVLPLAATVMDEWWRRFEETLPWRYATERQLL